MEVLFQDPAPIPKHAIAAMSAVLLGGTAARKCQGRDAASLAGMEPGSVDDLRQRVVFFYQRSGYGVRLVPSTY